MYIMNSYMSCNRFSSISVFCNDSFSLRTLTYLHVCVLSGSKPQYKAHNSHKPAASGDAAASRTPQRPKAFQQQPNAQQAKKRPAQQNQQNANTPAKKKKSGGKAPVAQPQQQK